MVMDRYRFCRKLEEGSFAGKTADFIMMLLFGSAITLVSIHLHHFTLVHVWVYVCLCVQLCAFTGWHEAR